MGGFFSKLKERLTVSDTPAATMDEGKGQDYVELDSGSGTDDRRRVTVRPFVIEEFEHIKPILDALREGATVALINIKPLKDKDRVELKRAINKLKNTCDAIDGDIAGFGEDWIAAVPSFAKIHRTQKKKAMGAEPQAEMSKVTEYS